MRTRLLAHAAVLFLLLPSLAARADEKIKALFRKCAPATVYIENKPNEDGSYSLGTGSIIDADGIIITNHHVIEPCLARDREVKVFLFDGRQFLGDVYASTRDLDLALVRIKDSPGGLPVMEWADSDAIEVGEDVVAIGNPDGYKWTLSQGIVSGKREDMIQTTAALNPGNSGGPLIGPDGKQVGVNTLSAYKDRNNIAFARSSKVAQDWIRRASAGDPGRAVTPRWTDPKFAFSVTPPQGWRALADEGGAQQRAGWASDDSDFRVYLVPGAGKRGIRAQAAEQEALLKKELKKYKQLKLDYYQFRGKEDAFGLVYSFAWDNAGYTSFQVSVNDNGDIWALRFTAPEGKYNALVPIFDATIQSAKWGAEQSNEAYSTPEKVLEAWVQSIRNSDIEAFLACIDIPAYLDSLTAGAWSKAKPAERKEMETRFRTNIETMLKAGQLAKQVEKGVRILAAVAEGERATVGVISVTDEGQTVIEDANLVLKEGRWWLTGFGAARPYEDGGKGNEFPGGTRELKRKTYKDEGKTFSVKVPEDWSSSANTTQPGMVMHQFSEEDPASNPATSAVVVSLDLRKALAQNVLTEEELDTFAENYLSGVKKEAKAKFTLKKKKKAKLGGLDAVELLYVSRNTALDPEIETRAWIAYKNGWAYIVAVVRQSGAEASPEFEKIVDSFKATAKR